MPFFVASAPVHNRFKTCASRPRAVGPVSICDPPIFLIRILHFQMNRVDVAQLIFPGTSTEASCLSTCSAYATDTFWLCNDFANRDQKSSFATFQSHSSMSLIKSVNELRLNVGQCFSRIFMLLHWSTCCSKACVSTPDSVTGGTHGHPLWMESCIESLQLTMVCAMHFYPLVPRTSADPPTHSVTIK